MELERGLFQSVAKAFCSMSYDDVCLTVLVHRLFEITEEY